MPLFLDGVGWFPFNGGQQAPEASMEPRMLMKIKQLSEKLSGCAGPSLKIKCLKLNRLSILLVGYRKAEK
jgi:hypothetical protein